MCKISHMGMVIEDLNVFSKYLRFRQKVSDGIQTSFYFNKDQLQTSIEIIYLVKIKRKIIFVEWIWTKQIFHYESY